MGFTTGRQAPGMANHRVIPRWVFCVGFYRVASAAAERWGPGTVVVAPLTIESFRDAVRHGEFVFIASHGGNPGDILLSDICEPHGARAETDMRILVTIAPPI